MKKVMCVLLSLLMLTGCTGTPEKPDEPIDVDPQPDPDPEEIVVPVDTVQELLDTLSLDEKIGQLFIIRLEKLASHKPTKEYKAINKAGVKTLDEDMIAVIDQWQPGGYCLFAKNISDPEQLRQLTEQLKEHGKIGPMVTIDEEGGLVSRIANNKAFDVTTYTNMYTIGNTGDVEQAFEVGKTIGAYLSEYGFNADFAPVADVFTNSKNTVIGKRSFGNEAGLVSMMVSSCLDGFHEQGIMTTLKHYPGHGDTAADSHQDTVTVSKTWEELEECELIPFKTNLDKTDMIMVAHIIVKGDEDPASLSYHAITEKLRKEYHYQGLIITDALEMGAIINHYTLEEAVVKAFLAGNDLLLMPTDVEKAIGAIKQAVEDGTISMERLDESVYRILKYKKKYFIPN